MAVGYYETNTLIEAVKRKATLPTNQSTFSNADFLAFANEELRGSIVPTIISLHEEYYVYVDTVSLEANKSSYSIPYRASGGKIRDLFYRDTNGNLNEMTRISPDNKALYQQTTNSGSFLFYYIEGNNIVITPSIGATVSGSLVFTYYMRPSDIVEESRVGEITAISVNSIAGTTTYTLDAVPSVFSLSVDYDLLQARPGHKIRKIDINASAIDTTNKTITFDTDDVDSETEVGDHVALAGECIIPQCPSDLHPLLAQRVATRCLEALGDTQGLTNANTKLQEMEMKSVVLIDNRAEGSPAKVTNHRGLLSSSISRRRRWF